MTTSANIIATDDVKSVWLIAKDYISMCDSGISTADDLYGLLLNGNRTLIMVEEDSEIKGACIARSVCGFKKIAQITTLGGDGADWNAAIEDFSRQLVDMGYQALEIQGRRGWLRSLSGFDELHTTIGKDL